MKIKNAELFVLTTIFVCLFFSSCFAQQKKETEADKVFRRAERFLQTVRDKKWDETYKFVVIITGKKDEVTRTRMNISDEDDEREIREKVAKWFKDLYEVGKTGEILKPIRFNAKDKTLATVSYFHSDIDTFNMRKVDEEWYYTLDYK